ncbi:MAG TPA: hypothetical protein VLI05_05965 [Candidatus Saccharimonadia bacterium]|nr:hypothetical protein [Candidatus Saccharimonadia bacterium]
MATYKSENPVNPFAADFSGAKPEHLASNRRFVERLASSPRGTTIFRYTDDPTGNGHYDLFVFPGQYREGAIPAPVLAKILGLPSDPAGQALKEYLDGWFIVQRQSREHEWNCLPSRPDEHELYRLGDDRYLAVGLMKDERKPADVKPYACITLGNPRLHTASGRVHAYLTPAQARELAAQLRTDYAAIEGENFVLRWRPEVFDATTSQRLSIRNKAPEPLCYSLEFPHSLRAALVNALLSRASQIEDASR